MVVEALWRNLKRLVLHLYNRPPVHLITFAVITKALPLYQLTLSMIVSGPQRGGCSPSLTHMQTALKKSWKRLRKIAIKGTYATDVKSWTCDCGAQKYHSYLLCKHLVQAAGDLPVSWWTQAIRYHIKPFYTIPVDDEIADPPETKRNHEWLRRMGLDANILHKEPASPINTPIDLTGIDSDDSDNECPISPVRQESLTRIQYFNKPY